MEQARREILDRIAVLYGWTVVAWDADADIFKRNSIMLERSPLGPFLHVGYHDTPEQWIEIFKREDHPWR